MKNLKWVIKKFGSFFKLATQFFSNFLKNKEIIIKLIDYWYKIKTKKINASILKEIAKVLPKLSKDQMREAGPLIEKVVESLNNFNGDDENDKNK